jgi:hypothetical protein
VKIGPPDGGKNIKFMVLRRIFGLEKEEVADAGEDCIMRSFITCTIQQIL